MKKQRLDRKTARWMLVLAFILLALALIWRAQLDKNAIAPRVARELGAHGISINADAIRQIAYEKNTTVSEMLDNTELESIVSASKKAGFDADLNRRGEVYCLAAPYEDGGVLTVFLVDEKIEFAFVQYENDDEAVCAVKDSRE